MAGGKQAVLTSGISKGIIQNMFRIENLNYAEGRETLYALERMNSFYQI